MCEEKYHEKTHHNLSFVQFNYAPPSPSEWRRFAALEHVLRVIVSVHCYIAKYIHILQRTFRSFFLPPWVTAAGFRRYDVTGSEASTETGWTVASLNCICLSACLSYTCTSLIFWFSCKFHFLASSCKLALGYSRLRVSHPCTQRVRNPYATCSLALQTRTQQAINQHTAAVSQPL